VQKRNSEYKSDEIVIPNREWGKWLLIFSEVIKHLWITLDFLNFYGIRLYGEEKGHQSLDGVQKVCGTEMVPKTCDDEVDLLDGREIWDLWWLTISELRIVRLVAEYRWTNH
jgi:hypothetical protein